MQTHFQEKKKQQSCIEITWIIYGMELIHCLAVPYAIIRVKAKKIYMGIGDKFFLKNIDFNHEFTYIFI